MAFDFTPAELELEFRNTDGVEVALGGETTWGHLDAMPVDALGGPSATGRELVLTLPTGRLSKLRQDAFLMVGTEVAGSALAGTRYRVRDLEDHGGGPETAVLLGRAD